MLMAYVLPDNIIYYLTLYSGNFVIPGQESSLGEPRILSTTHEGKLIGILICIF